MTQYRPSSCAVSGGKTCEPRITVGRVRSAGGAATLKWYVSASICACVVNRVEEQLQMSKDGGGPSDVEGGVSGETSTMTTLGSVNVSGGGGGGGGLSIEFGSRFVPYTTLSVCCLLFNGVALAALGFVRGPRTVHQRLLANLTIGDVVGTVLLWLYNNSCLLYTSPSPRDRQKSRMPSSA